MKRTKTMISIAFAAFVLLAMEGILYGQEIGIRTASTSGGIEKFCGGTRTPKPGVPLTG